LVRIRGLTGLKSKAGYSRIEWRGQRAMHIDILTLFPEMFEGPFGQSIVKKAVDEGLISIALHNIRDYASDKHRVTDDVTYGGGGGMVMKPEPIFVAVEAILGEAPLPPTPIILLSPQGRLLTQKVVWELAAFRRIVILCGHYEGVDERVRQYLATDEISIGDYVLTGGELPAMVLVDALTRLVPGVLGDPTAIVRDSHAQGLLEHPHYTRPPVYRGYAVPDVLLGGNHGKIALWRRQEALRRTYERRPDLLARARLTEQDRAFLEALKESSD
jgi:tRNA (guanine37-N1)-methyltransferase